MKKARALNIGTRRNKNRFHIPSIDRIINSTRQTIT